TRNLVVHQRLRGRRRLGQTGLASTTMKHAQFDITIGGLQPADVESLRHHLTAAAIHVHRGCADGDVAITSRWNSAFAVDDVLEVFREWCERRPKRRGAASIVVRHGTRSEVATALARRQSRLRQELSRQLIES